MTDPVKRFLDLVEAHPEACAVMVDEQRVTYAELGKLTRRIAAALRTLMPHPRVLIQLPQSAEAYAAMLGTLMAGGYYCPINGQLPYMRRAQIAKHLDPDVLIGRSPEFNIHDVVPGCRLLNIDSVPEKELAYCEEPDELAYIIYTSGSTGRPKGVMIRRAALSQLITWLIEAIHPDLDDRWGQFANLGFDMSVLDVYGALGSGARLVPLTTASERLLPASAVKTHGLTIWTSVPSVIDLMNRAEQINSESFKTLRLMCLGGEPLRPHHLEKLFEANASMGIFNLYGPTEATVLCTQLALDSATFRDACDTSVAIGAPIPGWRVDLVGGSGENEGEMVILGDNIGAGYWRSELETASAFRAIEIDGNAQRAYFTGDWAERRQGNLYFRGRMDRQVKIHGVRVELDEVDFLIRAFGVPNSCSVLLDNKIYSFLESKRPVNARALRQFLSQRLPPLEIPAGFVVRARLPRNHNDKIDTNQLLSFVKMSSPN